MGDPIHFAPGTSVVAVEGALAQSPRQEGIDRDLEYRQAGRGFTEPAVLRANRMMGGNMATSKQLHIYLDQNKWIDLARAYYDMSGGKKFRRILDRIRAGISNQTIVCPLSSEHVFETRKTRNLAKRKRLADVMSEISRGVTISPQNKMRQWEFARVLGKAFQKPYSTIPSAFGIGIPFAFGMEFIVRDESGSRVLMPEKFNLEVNELLASSETILNFLVGNDEATNIKALEQYSKFQEEFVKRVESFREKAKQHGKVAHRRAYIADLTIAIQDELIEVLESYGKTMKDFLNLGRDEITSIFENCPTADIEISLAVSRNEQWDKKVKGNDSIDIAFLTVAIPYCDVVVTEKFWGTLARQKNLHQKYRTLFSDLNELESILS